MITRLTKHDDHAVKIHLTKPNSTHYAALRCVDCNTHIQWLSKLQANELKTIGVRSVTPWANKEELGI